MNGYLPPIVTGVTTGTSHDVRPAHHHEAWMLRESAKGGLYCAACGDRVPAEEQATPPPMDLDPGVSIGHRCPRMREHITHMNFGSPGSHPNDLPVPCPDCFSIVVTSVRIPWQPSRAFTITDPTVTNS